MVIYLLVENDMYLPPLFSHSVLCHFFAMGRGMGGMLPIHTHANTKHAHQNNKQG